MFLHLPSSSRSDDLSQSNLLLRVSLGRLAVKTPTVGARRGADHCDHWVSLKDLGNKINLLGYWAKNPADPDLHQLGTGRVPIQIKLSGCRES